MVGELFGRMKMLSDKKTYIFAGLIALAAFAKAVGWIDEKTYELLMGLFGAGGLATLRAGVKKSGPEEL